MAIKRKLDQETLLAAGLAVLSVVVIGWLVHSLMWREFKAGDARLPRPETEILQPETDPAGSRKAPGTSPPARPQKVVSGRTLTA